MSVYFTGDGGRRYVCVFFSFLLFFSSFLCVCVFTKITVTLLKCKPLRANLLNASLKATYCPEAQRKSVQQ